MIKYSVIIPVYNMEKYLKDCVESVVSQKRNDVEIILVNDGSTDDSLRICNEFKEKNNNIYVIDKENSGTTETILMGIKKSVGKYICFIDADDYIETEYFKILDQYIEKDFDVIIYNYKRKYKNSEIFMEINNIPYGELEKEYIDMLHNELFLDFRKYSFYRWDKIIKSDIIKKNIDKIKFKITYLEDHIFSFLNLLSANKILHIKDTLYVYRMRNGSVSHSVNEKIFDDLNKAKIEMNEIADKCGIKKDIKEYLRLYFLYQYARFSLKSDNQHYTEKVKIKDIVKTKDKEKKIVLLLYKFKLKFIYKSILHLKLRKEKSKKLEYFD